MHRAALLTIFLLSIAGAFAPHRVHATPQEIAVNMEAPGHQAVPEDEQEAFLLSAEFVRRRSVGTGVTHSSRITLTDGTRTHDAHLQTVSERQGIRRSRKGVELNFRDSYTFNIAAYELSKMLGIGMVPVSVERTIGISRGAVTWWVDDVALTGRERFEKGLESPHLEHWNQQIHTMRVFDELIANTDRNLGNILITKDWRLWMVDHTRAFRRNRVLLNPSLLTRCDRRFLNALRNFDEAAVTSMLKNYVDHPEAMALIARVPVIVAHFDALIATRGEEEVLFDLDRNHIGQPAPSSS